MNCLLSTFILEFSLKNKIRKDDEMVKNSKGITANELVEELHLKPATAQKAIRLAKEQLVKQGFDWYANKRLGVVPRDVVSKILRMEL